MVDGRKDDKRVDGIDIGKLTCGVIFICLLFLLVLVLLLCNIVLIPTNLIGRRLCSMNDGRHSCNKSRLT